ncbi:MAG: multidrug transporter, partial [Acidobacteriales bacterium]
MRRKLLIVVPLVLLVVALTGWGGLLLYRASMAETVPVLPTTTVKRSDVRVEVTARGDLQGGKSEMLTAPMTGVREMVLKSLRTAGELVNEGDVIAEFDTTEQAFALREAEADLAEAEQQVIQATAESEARAEEAQLSLLQAKSDVELAEIDMRINPLRGAIEARQVQLKLDAARDRLRQLESDLAARKATTEAGVAIQEAGRNKVKVKADVARRNIAAMTLKAKSSGYVAIQTNSNTNMYYGGMRLPPFQVGDAARAGMAVAQIPDLKDWVVVARIGELDRGHLEAGQPVEITVVALPDQRF